MPLIDVQLRNAKPQGRPYRLFDGGGLYIEVSTAGGRLWRLKYRIDGREKRLSFGAYPDVGLAEAREGRDAARKLLSAGVDPSEQRKAQKAARADLATSSFEMIAREWHAIHSGRLASSTVAKQLQLLTGLSPIIRDT